MTALDNQQLIDDYLVWLIDNKGRAHSTADKYQAYLVRLNTYLKDRSILTATREELELFTGPMAVKQGLSGRSRRALVAAVRGFYKWAKSHRYIDASPAELVEYPKSARKLPMPITLENAERLIWAPDLSTFIGVRDSAMLAMLIGCGIRVSGLISLNQEDLIVQKLDDVARLIIRVTEKGGKQRAIPVPREAQLLLQMYLGHGDLEGIDRNTETGQRVLFVSINNRTIPESDYIGETRRLSRKAIWERIKKYGKRFDISAKQLSPHAFRHLYGTELAEEDVDEWRRQALLGHEDPKSTQIYTHLAMRKLMQTVDKANPLRKMNTPVTELLEAL